VNLRLIISVSCLATLVLLQTGCASRPSTPGADLQPGTWEVGNRPQMMFPGATQSELKALAMGAARSRAWTITESTEDRLVVQRPLDSGSPVAREIAPAGVVPGTLVEVTSYFVKERGGVNVALDAAVVSQAPGGTPTRTDYTETFRPSLTESLRSLNTSWSQNRGRLARAAPPLGAGSASNDRDGGGGDELVSTNTGALPDADDRKPAAWTNEAAAAIIARPDQPQTNQVATAPRMAAPARLPPAPPAAPPAPVSSQADRSSVRPVTASPEPRRPPGGPAPVVDASPSIRSIPSTATTQPMTLPDPIPQTTPVETISSDENMMALYPAAGTVSWAYYAEQYARLRGCNVSSSGSILIDSRSDGEIHKVPCDGADSILVQCYNGECRGLL